MNDSRRQIEVIAHTANPSLEMILAAQQSKTVVRFAFYAPTHRDPRTLAGYITDVQPANDVDGNQTVYWRLQGTILKRYPNLKIKFEGVYNAAMRTGWFSYTVSSGDFPGIEPGIDGEFDEEEARFAGLCTAPSASEHQEPQGGWAWVG